jgi:tRNA(Ile)-lysidine synthase
MLLKGRFNVGDILKKVKNTISRYGMIRSGDRIVVAVSGGPDSVCLLDILNELRDDLGIELVVAHYDHGLRPGEDETETRFVETLAGSLDLPFEMKKAATGLEGSGPLEERARHARYCFFDEVKEKRLAQKIATGHNLNDQSETVLMRLLRGSGVTGLAGIPPVRDGSIIRPLISITRDDIMSYLDMKGLKYVTDSSNSETYFLRNRIRLEVLPKLKEIQPRLMELLGRTAGIMRRDDEWMEQEAEAWIIKDAEIREHGEVLIPLSLFKPLSEALKYRVIRCALRMAGETLRRISLTHIEDVLSLSNGEKPQAGVNLPNGLIVRRMYDKLIFNRGEGRVFDEFSYTLEGHGISYLEALECTISIEEKETAKLPDTYTSPWTAYLNADRITFPVVVRNFRPGDRFVPFGMSGHKKLKDFFIDLKIPAEDRARIPILTHDNSPVWVCGFRIDDRYKVMPDTEKVLKITVKKGARSTACSDDGRQTPEDRKV